MSDISAFVWLQGTPSVAFRNTGWTSILILGTARSPFPTGEMSIQLSATRNQDDLNYLLKLRPPWFIARRMRLSSIPDEGLAQPGLFER